jgi:nitrogen regulatory protein P-II 1
MEQVPGFTFSQVEGYGNEVENDPFVSARDAVLGHIPRIRTDILLEDNDVKEVLSRIRTQHSNITGQGVFWITDVITGGHIR